MVSRHIVWLLLAWSAIALGWSLAAYALARVFSAGNPALAGLDVCSALFESRCDASLLSPRAWQLGVPLAGWGAIYFALLGFLLAIGWNRGALALAAFGMGASLALTTLMLSGAAHGCFVCYAFHLTNGVTLVSLVAAARSRLPLPPEATPSSLKHREVLGSLAQLVGLILIGCLGQSLLWRNHDTLSQWLLDRQAILTAYEQSPRLAVKPLASDPHRGPLDAVAQIVVFSSFQCPGCRTLAQQLDLLRARFGDRVNITFKHYPLSTRCNARAQRDLQPTACGAALAAAAAHQQAKFWPYHDALLTGSLALEESQLNAAARMAQLDLRRWDQDRQGAAAARTVQQDIATGNDLNLDETPALFLNGRRVRTLSLPALVWLIEATTPSSSQTMDERPSPVVAPGT